TSDGYQIAAAAAEFVSSPICSAKIEVSNPFSANRIAQVSQETPEPIIATRGFIERRSLLSFKACRIAMRQLHYRRGGAIGKIADGQGRRGRNDFAGGS